MKSRTVASTNASVDRSRWLLLVALFVVAAALRAPGLNGGLWVDEIYSLVRSFRMDFRVTVTNFWGDNHHPLYSLLAHLSITTLGESPWAMRLPALLFGAASVPMLYALGERVASRREALLASALLAVSYHHVWFSQNARGYSAIAFFAILTTYAMLRALGEGRRRHWVLYAAAAALGAYTHLTMVFVVVGQTLASAWAVARGERSVASPPDVGQEPRARPGWRGPLFGLTLAAVLTVAMYVPMADQLLEFFRNRQVGGATPGWLVREGFRILAVGMSGGVMVVGVIAAVAGVALVVAGLASYTRRDTTFALAVVLPVIVTFIAITLAGVTTYPRYFFFLIGPALLVVVRGAVVSAEWIARLARSARPEYAGGLVATILIGCLAALSALSLPGNYRLPKQDFDGAVRFVLDRQHPGDRVVTAGIPGNPPMSYFGQPWPRMWNVAQLDSVRAGTRRVWMIYSFPRDLARDFPRIAATIRSECVDPRTFRGTVGDGDIVVCRLESP